MNPPVLDRILVKPQIKPGIDLDGGTIRLNLGGIGDDGKERLLKGFYIVDIQDSPLTDIRTDIADLSVFKDESVSEIYASNCLEHFPHTETVKVLTEWCRVLKKGATCWISVPDLDANLRLFQKYGQTDWLTALLWGDQIHPYAYHYINFTYGYLAHCCMKAGFTDVQRLKFMPFGLSDASAICNNHDNLPVALNVKVIK